MQETYMVDTRRADNFFVGARLASSRLKVSARGRRL